MRSRRSGGRSAFVLGSVHGVVRRHRDIDIISFVELRVPVDPVPF